MADDDRNAADPQGFLARFGHALERHQFQRRLEGTADLFEQLIENALDIIGIIDAEGVLTFLSPATRR